MRRRRRFLPAAFLFRMHLLTDAQPSERTRERERTKHSRARNEGKLAVENNRAQQLIVLFYYVAARPFELSGWIFDAHRVDQIHWKCIYQHTRVCACKEFVRGAPFFSNVDNNDTYTTCSRSALLSLKNAARSSDWCFDACSQGCWWKVLYQSNEIIKIWLFWNI